MINRVRGTEDLLDLTLHNFVLETTKKHLSCHNFGEVQTPILEHTNLFVRSLGSETDVVSKEMYTFQQNDGESICLRPEGTASVIRAYIENGVQVQPWKVFTWGPMFRHERPQKGRWRQFTQVSMEVVNSNSIMQDALFLKMLDDLFTRILHLDTYVLKLNFLGCSDDRKNHKAQLLAFLEAATDKICATCMTRKDKNTLRVFDCKNEDCKKLYTTAPTLLNCLCEECQKEWDFLTETLQMLSVNFVVDSMLVRGLDYYNKTAFEFSSRDLGAQNTFCGGGRYALGKELGSKEDIPCIGAAIGLGRLLLLVENIKQKLQMPQAPALHVIIPFTQDQLQLALLVAQKLSIAQLCYDVLLEGSSVTNMMKKANKLGAKYAILLGPDEQAQGTVCVKNMNKGETVTVKQVDVITALI